MAQHLLYTIVKACRWRVKNFTIGGCEMHSDLAIANSFWLWGEYIDPDATMTESEFDAMSVTERLRLIRDTFPDQYDGPEIGGI